MTDLIEKARKMATSTHCRNCGFSEETCGGCDHHEEEACIEGGMGRSCGEECCDACDHEGCGCSPLLLAMAEELEAARVIVTFTRTIEHIEADFRDAYLLDILKEKLAAYDRVVKGGGSDV